ncbi:MAG: glycosyltransferase family 39 protein [Pyrinomonadaceae bacterium]
MLAKRSWIVPVLAAAAIVSYLYGLGMVPLLGPDEPRYAQVAREMYATRDLVTPTLGGHTWFEKPSLLYWLMIVSYRLWGVSEYAARLPAACCGLFTILTVAWLTQRIERTIASRSAEWLAVATSAVLASSIGLIAFSRGASFDIVLTALITLALCCFIAADLEPQLKRQRWLLAGFYAGVGFALLAKGLIGLVIPCATIGSYLLLQRRWPSVKSHGLIWGPVLAAAIAASWYAPVIARHGWPFVHEFFVQHHFARYVSNKYRHPQPFYFYLWVAPLLVLPWTPFLLQAIKTAVSWNWQAAEAMERLRVFAFLWMVVPIGFFSLSGSKLPGYILPALPAMALLAGDQLASYLRGGLRLVRTMRLTGLLVFVIGAAGSFYAVRSGVMNLACGLLIASLVCGAGLTAFWLRERNLMCVAAIVGAAFIALLLAVTCASTYVTQRQSIRDLLNLAAKRGYQASPIVNLHTVERGAEFYGSGRLIYDSHGEPLRLDGPSAVVEFVQRSGSGGPLIVLIPVQYVQQLTDNAAISAEIIGDNTNTALVVVKRRRSGFD